MPWTTRPAIRTLLRAGGAGDERADREQGHAARRTRGRLPTDVAEPAGGDDAGGEGQQVGVLDPLQAVERRVQVVVDRRQRERDHGRVEHQHEQPRAGPDQHPPGVRPCAARLAHLRGERIPMLGGYDRREVEAGTSPSSDRAENAALGRVPRGDEALSGRRPRPRSTRSASRSRRARSACSSGRPDAARRRRCGWSTGWSRSPSGDILIGDRSVRDRVAGRAAARDRLRDPADRPVPAPHDRPEHRHGPGPARLGRDRARGARRPSCSS